MKSGNMIFIAKEVSLINRGEELDEWSGARTEHITLNVKLISSGDCTKFTTQDIIAQVLKMLESIEQPNKIT
jgi:hypothetical protein